MQWPVAVPKPSHCAVAGEKLTGGEKLMHSKTVGCGEKLTGILKEAEKSSPTNLDHKLAMSEMSELV